MQLATTVNVKDGCSLLFVTLPWLLDLQCIGGVGERGKEEFLQESSNDSHIH